MVDVFVCKPHYTDACFSFIRPACVSPVIVVTSWTPSTQRHIVTAFQLLAFAAILRFMAQACTLEPISQIG